MMRTWQTPGGPPPIAKIVGAVILVVVGAVLGIPLISGSNPGSGSGPGPGPAQPPAVLSAPQPADRPSSEGPSTAASREAPAPRSSTSASPSTAAAPELEDLLALVDARASGEMVTARAQVYRILEDDDDGATHQRFLISIDPGARRPRTVKVSHNLDLAERIPVEEGDMVTIRGQFEWNDLGGALHWTHHDPAGRREGGWIEHNGRRYE